MSRVRTVEQLGDRLSENAKRRKRELITIRQMLPPAVPAPLDLWLRLSPVFAYAHWEGFVKDSATLYLKLVSEKSYALSGLKPNMQALACRSEMLVAVGANKRIRPHLAVVDRLVDRIAESVTVPNDAIDTESNLNWEVFENLCAVVGISTDGYWNDHRGLIDDMFRARCEVAHGQLFTPGTVEAVQYVDFTLRALSVFTTDLENAAATKAHLRRP